jgi:choice-of-anchor B domain-containing protein
VGPDGREYGLITVKGATGNGGTSIVDLSNPRQPKEVAFAISPRGNWHELKTYRNYLYKCADQGTAGLQIFDLARLPAGIDTLPSYKAGGVTRCHTLWLDSTRHPPLLYIQQTATQGVFILSLANPAMPVEAGRVATSCHDGFARGNRLYVSTGAVNSWETWDVANPAQPQRIMRMSFASHNQALGEPVNSYSHNVWLSEDGKYAFTTQETAGTTLKSWDLSDEANPKLLGHFVAHPRVIAHNAQLNRHLMYLAHNSAGLRILDVRDPARMVEVAYHKPDPGNDSGGGTWSHYNWFPSGILIHGDRATGLYIVDPDPDIKLTGVPTSLGPRAFPTGTTLAVPDMQGVRFHLPRTGAYELTLLDPSGREVLKTRSWGEAGPHRFSWNGKRRPAPGGLVARLKQ